MLPNLTKEEEEYLQEQLKYYREKTTKEKEIKKIKEEVETSIRKLYNLVRKGEFTDALDEILNEYNYELYDIRW